MAAPLRKQPRRAARQVKPVILADHAESDSDGSKDNPDQNERKDFFDSLAADLPKDFDEAEQSDYESKPGKRKRKTAPASQTPTPQWLKKTKRAREAPEASDLSDLSSDDEHEEDTRLFERRKRLIPAVKAKLTSTTLRLDVRTPTVINIDLAGLLSRTTDAQQAPAGSPQLDGSTLLVANDYDNSPRTVPCAPQASPSQRLDTEHACFLDLEPAIRNRIYRELLVQSAIVKVSPFSASTRQPALLRTCHQIHEEGRGILYGENAFHFERNIKSRSRYGDKEDKEVGYKDVRRFLEAIGPHNVAKLRFVSLHFSDAIPSLTPLLEAAERKYVNDPVLHKVLKLIGRSGCILDKFVVGFDGRADVAPDDIIFLRAFTSISIRGQLVKTCKFGHSKVNGWVWGKLKDFMKGAKLDFDPDRQKAPKMQHDTIDRSWCRRRYSNWHGAGCSD